MDDGLHRLVLVDAAREGLDDLAVVGQVDEQELAGNLARVTSGAVDCEHVDARRVRRCPTTARPSLPWLPVTATRDGRVAGCPGMSRSSPETGSDRRAITDPTCGSSSKGTLVRVPVTVVVLRSGPEVVLATLPGDFHHEVAY